MENPKKVGAQNFRHLPFLYICLLNTKKYVFCNGKSIKGRCLKFWHLLCSEICPLNIKKCLLQWKTQKRLVPKILGAYIFGYYPLKESTKKVGAQNFVHLPFLDIRIISTQKHVFYDGIFKIGRADQNIGLLPFFGY